LNQTLYAEFKDDFNRLFLEVDTINGVIQFSSPDVLFNQGKASVKQEFADILSEFYPRYLNILNDPEFKPFIREIRVEGHTSKEWETKGKTTTEQAYLNNLELSQLRSFEVLNLLLQMPDDGARKEWFRNKAAAMGYSSSKLILTPDGAEDKERSRRVSFRALLDYEKFMVGRSDNPSDS
jgi:outer membrane protein OmpA-like peptidoglycan-associated protein